MVRGHCRDQSGATASMAAYHRSGGPDLSLVFNFEGSGKQGNRSLRLHARMGIVGSELPLL